MPERRDLFAKHCLQGQSLAELLAPLVLETAGDGRGRKRRNTDRAVSECADNSGLGFLGDVKQNGSDQTLPSSTIAVKRAKGGRRRTTWVVVALFTMATSTAVCVVYILHSTPGPTASIVASEERFVFAGTKPSAKPSPVRRCCRVNGFRRVRTALRRCGFQMERAFAWATKPRPNSRRRGTATQDRYSRRASFPVRCRRSPPTNPLPLQHRKLI